MCLTPPKKLIMDKVKITFILLFCWLRPYAADFSYVLTGTNQSVLILENVVVSTDLESGSTIGAFYTNASGELKCAGSAIWVANEALGFPVWGSDYGLDNGFGDSETIMWFAIGSSGVIYELSMVYGDNQPNIYQTNSFRWISAIDIGISEGCTNANYFEFSPLAMIDDGSCETEQILGCTNPNSSLYNPLANSDDGSCFGLITPGCMEPQFYEYNQWATIDDGSCNTYWQAMYFDVLWENEDLEEQLTSISITLDNKAQENALLNSQITALEDQASNLLALLSQLELELNVLELNNENLVADLAMLTAQNEQLVADIEEIQLMCLNNDSDFISVNIEEGWNMIGFTHKVPMDVGALFEDELDNIILVKDNEANMFWPEFGFNGIGNLQPGFGYQVKASSAIHDFTFPYIPGLRLEMSETVPEWVFEMEAMHTNDVKTLVKKVNLLGQELYNRNFRPGEVVLYLYSDGSVEKHVH